MRQLRAGQKLALTGTPVENRLSSCGRSSTRSTRAARQPRAVPRHRYAKPIERDGDADARPQLRRRLTQPFVLRRTKADRTSLPDLPDKIEQIAWAAHPRAGGALPARRRPAARRRADGRDEAAGLVLAALTRLKQICNHPAHALGDGSPLGGRSGKLARFDELVDELLDVGERALVFTQFREMGDLLRGVTPPSGSRAALPFLHGGVAECSPRRDGRRLPGGRARRCSSCR